jgi:hypothetical protein
MTPDAGHGGLPATTSAFEVQRRATLIALRRLAGPRRVKQVQPSQQEPKTSAKFRFVIRHGRNPTPCRYLALTRSLLVWAGVSE